MSNDLASKLREGTKHSHTAAENTAFTKCFLKGVVKKEFFRKQVASLYFVYSTLEEEIQRHINHPLVSLIYFPELERKEKLAEDLAFYYGENWQEEIVASEESKAYMARIQEVANTEPALLVAHAYVRYMGDLSGGQRLKGIARSAMNLPPDVGTGLHEFDQLPTVEVKRAFKGKYRDTLNSLPVDDGLAEKIVEEANNAFTLNRNLAQELEPDVIAAVGKQEFESLTAKEQPGSTEKAVTR
ncbi:MAG: heme oxygenase (biliverdin-producing) [Symploca sp. SIO1B1]|nr:heme oxygenase (biliverdin-producing) [Symploca sp. SIO1A3]NER99205.1 heme oxygenase (biliverdin-producing) [Symploca sp. SIO1B1]